MWSRRAQARPEIPPPMMMVSRVGIIGSVPLATLRSHSRSAFVLFLVLFEVKPEIGHSRLKSGKQCALDQLGSGEGALRPAYLAPVFDPVQHHNMTFLGIDDPVFSDPQLEVFFTFLLVIALLRSSAVRDDRDHQVRALTVAIHPGEVSQDHRQVGMTIRLQLGNDQADVAAMADPADQARVLTTVFTEGLLQIINNLPMIIAGYLGHFEHSSSQLIKVSGLFFRLAELLEGHPAPVVGRADAKVDGGHVGLLRSAGLGPGVMASCILAAELPTIQQGRSPYLRVWKVAPGKRHDVKNR